MGTATPSVTGGGLGNVLINGIGYVNLVANAGTVTVDGTAGSDSFVVTPISPNGASLQAVTGGSAQNGQGGTNVSQLPAVGPLLIATGVSTALGGFTINGGGGSDQIFLEATQGADTIDVNDAASGVNAVKVDALLVINYNAAFAHVEVDALAGSDTINIAPSATTTFLVDGGDPIGVIPGDTLNLLHPAGDAYTLFPGPTGDSGGLSTATLQTVSWVHIEFVTNSSPAGAAGPALILGTNGNDEITVIARDGSYNPAAPGTPNPLLDGVQDFTVSINGGPDVLFINTPNLFIDALSGNDDIVVQEPAPNQAAWNVQIYVAAGAPSSGSGILGDTIELDTPGKQSVTYNPNEPVSSIPPVANVTFTTPTTGGGQFVDSTTSSSVTATQFLIGPDVPPAMYQSSSGGAEQFVYTGEAGNDNLIYNSPANASGSNLVYTPGANPDAGTITGTQIGGSTLTPLTFSNLGTVGNSVAFTTANVGRTDHLNVEGSAAGETFSVNANNGGTIQVSHVLESNTNLITIPITAASVSILELDGLGGTDLFNLSGTLPFTSTILNDGGTVTLVGATAATAPVTVNLADNSISTPTTITGYGGTVSLIDIDVADLNAGGFAAVVNGTTQPDDITVTPTATGSDTVTNAGLDTTFYFNSISTAVGAFLIDPLGGNNTVTVDGSSANDTIGVVRGATNDTVTVNSILPAVTTVNTNTQSLVLATGTGTDTVNVSGTTGPALTVLGGQTPASAHPERDQYRHGNDHRDARQHQRLRNDRQRRRHHQFWRSEGGQHHGCRRSRRPHGPWHQRQRHPHDPAHRRQQYRVGQRPGTDHLFRLRHAEPQWPIRQ